MEEENDDYQEEDHCEICGGAGEIDILVSEPDEPHLQVWDVRMCDCQKIPNDNDWEEED